MFALLMLTLVIKPVVLFNRIINYFTPDSKGQQADLYLKIFNQNTMSMIKLTTIPLDHKIEYTSIPNLHDFSVTFNKLWPIIRLSWAGELEFKFNEKSDEIRLPKFIKAPITTSLSIQSIKTGPYLKFYALLFVPHQENKFYYFDQLNKHKI